MARTQKNRRPTMLDVAKLAGVSQTTVSFVINNNTTVAIPSETRERVLGAVRKLGYRPNVIAQGLRRQRSTVIGFLTDEIASTPYAVHIIEGAQAAAWSSGYILMIVNTARNEAIKEAGVDLMLDRQVDGIIYASMFHREVRPPANIREVPAVLLDCFVADRSLPSVVPNEVQGGRDATQALLRKGHRRIGFINVNEPSVLPAAAGRLEGYRPALAAGAVEFDASLVLAGDGDPPSGYHLTLELMQSAAPPTAIFCGNDRQAMGAYDALRELQLSIPDDVAIIGFDNQDIIAQFLRPSLSTMALPHYQMGQWAVQYLVEHNDMPDKLAPVQHMIECPLVERESI